VYDERDLKRSDSLSLAQEGTTDVDGLRRPARGFPAAVESISFAMAFRRAVILI
jgi:hypothetical protein